VDEGPFELCTVDVWDTLLRRECHPDAVKLHTCNELLIRAGDSVDISLRDPRALLKLRLAFEGEQGRAARASGFDDEYALPEVIDAWLARAAPDLAAPERATLSQALQDEELRQEGFVSYADPGITSALACVSAKRWMFLSDFYLSSTQLAALLESKGFAGRFDGGVSSADARLNKRSGRLYAEMQRTVDIAPGGHCHIGDDPVSDVRVPNALGIHTVPYENAP
jgi:FMN phosphatase YigB (HAD superfamily)